MGQRLGRLPKNPELLIEEQRRVLHWSAEVIARAEDNVDAENTFLLDFNDTSIADKVDKWLDHERSFIASINAAIGKSDRDAFLELTLFKIGNEVKRKMRKDYDKAYEDLRRFARLVDDLADEQRKIHKDILDLEKIHSTDVEKFRRRFASLRVRVFRNLRLSEKMLFRDRRLKDQFNRKVHEIDRENLQLCKRKVRKLIDSFCSSKD